MPGPPGSGFYVGERFKLLAMPFKGGAEPVQMVVILPDRPDGLSGLEAGLSRPRLTAGSLRRR